MSDALPSDHTSPLGRDMDCPNCLHSLHHLRCGCDLGNGIECPCRGVAVPGIYPAA